MPFELPVTPLQVWLPWQFHLESQGNGLIYLNGHCLGRYWQSGPQRDFVLPDCWLHFGKAQIHSVISSLRLLDNNENVQRATVEPVMDFAEFRLAPKP